MPDRRRKQYARQCDLDALLCNHGQKKTFCIYDAPSPEAIRKAAKRNNLPVDEITQVDVVDPYFYR